jgi:hypothetical protein
MILDERNEFADAVSVAAAAGTALIGDVIDLGSASRDIGAGQPLYLIIQTSTEIITGGSAGTIKFQLASDSTANLATSATIHIETATFVTDDAATKRSLLGAAFTVFADRAATGANADGPGMAAVAGDIDWGANNTGNTQFVLLPNLMTRPSYDAIASFEPVSHLVTASLALAVQTALSKLAARGELDALRRQWLTPPAPKTCAE